MPRVELEPTIPVFERAKTVHVLDRAATVIVAQLSIQSLLWRNLHSSDIHELISTFNFM
jgi:hypothetical protein